MCSFPHFSPTCFDTSSWNFAYDLVLLYYRSSCSVINFRQFLLELWPFWNEEYRNTQFSALFSYTLWHIELKFCIWLCFTVVPIKFECRQLPSIFIRPSSDGTYYGMVMSVRVSLRVSVRPSVRPSVRLVSVRPFSSLLSYMPWHIELKFCTRLCFNVLQIKFECHHFVSIFEGVMPLCELRI